jgi:hypothetical protein
MPPHHVAQPGDWLVTLLEVVTGNLAGKFGKNLALRPTHRLRAWIRLQLELDVPVGYHMRDGHPAIVCGLPTL